MALNAKGLHVGFLAETGVQPFGCGYKANQVGIIADVPLSESYTSGWVSNNSMFEDANLGYYVAAT